MNLSWTASLTLALSLWVAAFAQVSWAKDFSSWTKYSQAELVNETNAWSPGAIGTLGFKIKLAQRWHTYWVNPGDSGTALNLQFKTGRGIKIERVLFPVPKREQTGPLITFGYNNEVLIPIEVQVARSLHPGDTTSVEVAAEWLVCEDVCIPAFQTLRIDVPIVATRDISPSLEFPLFQQTRAHLPRPVPDFPKFEFGGTKASLALPVSVRGDELIDFFPFRSSGVTNARPKRVGDVLGFEKSNVPAGDVRRVGVLVVKSAVGGEIEAFQYGDSGWTFESQGEPIRDGLLWMLLSAFLGGLILNLMPCVFPILSIKLLSLLKIAKAHPREVRAQNLAYVLGVLLSFLGIALVLSLLRSAGHLIGWGFQLQSPVFLSLLTWLFFALCLNLLGLYEFDLLNANLGNRLTRLSGFWGSFFTGVLAVVVASPCTAPFMGVALGFGLAQPSYILLSVFFMLGLGLAFPYLLFVIFPSWAAYLPRPGAWMKLVKQVMAVPLFLTTVWMLWILGQVRESSAVYVVIAGCAALALAFWFSSWRRTVARIVAFVVLLGGIVFIYRSESRVVSAKEHDGGIWQAFSEPRLSSLKGHNLFVNMTADWCLSCKVNERLVFDDPEVQALLKAKDVIWLKGDWTERNEEITRFLNRYDRVGVPFYVLFSAHDPMGTTLPEVLTKSSFIDFINKEFP